MCMQYEREDLIKIYLHRPQDYGKLLKADHDMIISQADNKLKVARGKAMLPRLTRDEVLAIFEVIMLLNIRLWMGVKNCCFLVLYRVWSATKTAV